ncbi:hypothetical protein ABPG72_007676 [Tetrahymena utriculariae]
MNVSICLYMIFFVCLFVLPILPQKIYESCLFICLFYICRFTELSNRKLHLNWLSLTSVKILKIHINQQNEAKDISCLPSISSKISVGILKLIANLAIDFCMQMKENMIIIYYLYQQFKICNFRFNYIGMIVQSNLIFSWIFTEHMNQLISTQFKYLEKKLLNVQTDLKTKVF